MKRSILLVLTCACALVIALFSLSACGGSSSSSSSSSQSSSSSASTSNAEGSEDAGDVSADDLSQDEIRSVFEQAIMGMSEYYKGTTPVGEQLYYAGGADGENAVFVLIVPETNVSAIFIGPVEVGDDNVLAVTDETTGNQISFQVFDNGDDTYSFSMGEQYGAAVMTRCSANEIVDALTEVVAATANSTDESAESTEGSQDATQE